jgi:hypothetical protein
MNGLIEVEPGRWRVDKRGIAPARSALPCPHVISDTMDPTEQVDGKFYTSKSAFRAVGKELGLTEIGTEKIKPKQRASATREQKEKRKKSLKLALDKYKAGYRSKR